MTHSALNWTAQRLADVTHGQWQGNPPVLAQPRIITDTRKLQQGDIFLALKGERFDAHDFLAQAAAAGAVAAMVSRVVADVGLAQLRVADTRLALGHVGAAQRQALPQLQVVALTGSSGKTTTKEMLGSILALNAPILMTRGNLNNDLGVPMMLLELQADQRYAVMELGANHVGEIAYTSAMVQPQVAGVLNIGSAHVGEFGGRDGIARAKSEIFSGLPANGVAVMPAQDDFADVLAAAAAPYRTLRFGVGGDVFASDIQLGNSASQFVLNTPSGCIDVDLPFAGRHNIDNALAAATFAHALNIDLKQIAEGLSRTQGIKGRLAFSQHQHLTIIDDTYNANPHSIRAAAQVLCAQNGLKFLILGDIAELGDQVVTEHHQLGRDLAALPLDHVLAVGQYAADTVSGYHAANGSGQASAFVQKADLLAHLRQQLPASAAATLLFKGSRSATMETLIRDLLETP